MDKLNYRIQKGKKQEIKKKIQKLFRKVERILNRQQIKVLQRKRIVKNYKTLFRAALLYICQHLSFQRLSDTMASVYNVSMSDTAWRKQLIKLAPVFFSAVLECVLSSLRQWDYCSRCRVLERFKLYLLDTTRFSVEGGNGTAVQVHTQICPSALSDLFMKVTDCHTAESVTNFEIRQGALYMADRAYGRANQLISLLKDRAQFIIRISPSHIVLYQDKECRKKIVWDKLLTKSPFSLSCFIKADKAVRKIRLVGMQIPEEKHSAIEKRLQRTASKKQTKLQESTIEYAKWLLLAVSVPNVRTTDILDLYRLRWQIELFFKKVKTLFLFRKIRRSSHLFQISSVLLWLSFIIFLSLISSSSFPSSVSNFNSFSLALSHLLSALS